MANKKFWLGMLVMVLVFGMTVVGCDDDDDEKTVTFRLAKSGGNSFTVTVEGAKWNRSVSSGSIDNLLFSQKDLTFSSANGNPVTMDFTNDFNGTRTSDTVYTFTLRTSSWTGVQGTIKLRDNPNGANLTDGGESATYVNGSPAGLTW